jgi:hypothetical protein
MFIEVRSSQRASLAWWSIESGSARAGIYTPDVSIGFAPDEVAP